MLPLGRWVMHEVCRQTRAWIDAGLPAVPVAVNISSGKNFAASIFWNRLPWRCKVNASMRTYSNWN